jgi:hypothetical protein
MRRRPSFTRRQARPPGVARHSNLASSWALPDGGVLLRMSGVSVEQVGAALRQRFTFLRGHLGDDPWSRKW